MLCVEGGGGGAQLAAMLPRTCEKACSLGLGSAVSTTNGEQAVMETGASYSQSIPVRLCDVTKPALRTKALQNKASTTLMTASCATCIDMQSSNRMFKSGHAAEAFRSEWCYEIRTHRSATGQTRSSPHLRGTADAYAD